MLFMSFIIISCGEDKPEVKFIEGKHYKISEPIRAGKNYDNPKSTRGAGYKVSFNVITGSVRSKKDLELITTYHRPDFSNYVIAYFAFYTENKLPKRGVSPDYTVSYIGDEIDNTSGGEDLPD